LKTFGLTIGCFLIFMLLIGPIHAQSCNEELLIDGYRVEFLGVEYNATADVSTWTYHIARLYGPHLQDLQVGVCGQSLPVVVNASHPVDLIAWDRSPGYALDFHFPSGMDWDRGETVWFSLLGKASIGNAPVASSLIDLRTAGAIAGPSCLVVSPCSIDFHAETTNLNWAFLRPGTYASKAITIHVFSTSDVILTFDGFGHAIYLADSTKPTLLLAYSIGETIFEAENTFGWRDAGDTGINGFNGTQVLITAAEMTGGGKTITVWAKASLSEQNSSSEYEAGGTISIRSVCP
jgi:hypothetical protein